MKAIDRAIKICDASEMDLIDELADKISAKYNANNANRSKIDNWLDKNASTTAGIGDLNLNQLKRLASYLGIKF